ncbi:MAG: NnrS family protein [Gammaproteobacteria bacterium]
MSNRTHTIQHASLNMGFRPLFALAGLFSVLATLAWTGMYLAGLHVQMMAVAPATWHAHEMVYGYALAVIAGFLLTAVRNWTGIQTLHGIPLLLLVLIWLTGRVLFLVGNTIPPLMLVIVDCSFTAGLIVALLIPIVEARQWQQLGILSKLLLLLASNLVFHAGLLGMIDDGIRIGLYSGVYIIVALIFVMARRVYPFFIERGVGYTVALKNRPWLDIGSLLLFLAFWIMELVAPDSLPVALLSVALALLHALRLADWYTAGIWRKALLWILFIGYAWLVAAFVLKAAVYFFGISPFLALHAFAFGGIGMITVGMMSRITLAHTGRDIDDPPALLSSAFAILLAGSVARIVLPLLDPAHYIVWIGLAQGLWVTAFVLFVYICLPMLWQPRIDGKPG